MSEERHDDWPTKTELMDWINRSWAALETTIESLDATQMTRSAGPDRWSIKDHLAHLTAWERSLLAILNGQDRAAALGLDRATYEAQDFDGKNAVIQRATREQRLVFVLAAMQKSHQAVLEALAPLSDADLRRPYSSFQPTEQPPDDRPVVGWIIGNTAGHYEEHLAWIQELIQ